MRLHRFSEGGLIRFREWLECSAERADSNEIAEMLSDTSLVECVENSVEVPAPKGQRRWDYASALFEMTERAGLSEPEFDKEMWAWLTLYFFDDLCPIKESGSRKMPRDLVRLMPSTSDFRRYYRHYLLGPFRIYKAYRDNPENSAVLLIAPINVPGEVVEQLASRQEIVTNRAAIELATSLYVSSNGRSYKRGSARKTDGGARRFADVLNQLDLTWDLYAMNREEIESLLPREFDRFLAQ